MKVSFYDFLSTHQASNRFLKSDEMAFFLGNRVLLTPLETMIPFLKASDSFSITRANILIRGLLNKKTIERLFSDQKKKKEKGNYVPFNDYMEMGTSDLPYLTYKEEKIFIPFFPLSLNHLYSADYEKLDHAPYKSLLSNFESLCIDAFDYYGSALFDSYFTKLVKIKEVGKVSAFFDYDAETFYFINDEGRLDAKLALFDKYLEKPVRSHIAKRLVSVADAYFYEDKNALIDVLFKNGFISLRLICEYRKKEGK